MNNEKKQIILNWLKQQEETDSLTQEQRDIFALIRESLHTKKYGLVFEEKEEDIVNEANNSILTLKQKDLIIANNNAKELNYLLEGDNYQALKLLQKTHKNRIDVIYIDPPYNTGNKDFIYNDTYVDSEDGFRHSKWLSFMKKRLEQSKTLLKNDGIIYISIKYTEHSQLKLLCDEIFGEKNLIADIVWTNNEGGGSSDSKFFKTKHEYILCYSKDIDNLREIIGIDIEDHERYKLSDEFEKERGKYQLVKLSTASLTYTKSLDYPIECPDGTFVMPVDNTNKNRARWRWSKQKLEWGKENGFVEFKKDKKNIWQVYTKQYLYSDANGNSISKRTKKPYSIIDKYSSTQGTNQLFSIIGESYFSYPKPLGLIEFLLERFAYNNSIILDFFAGSGTTGHAVAKLNAEDGGNRTYILCTNNENNICENVTFKRLSNIQEELPHSLIYQQIEAINKDEFIVSNYSQKYLDQLEESSKQLAQLELGKLIDNKEIFFITSQDELENANEDDLLNATVIFMNENKVDPYRSKVYDHIKNKIIIIPDNYYEKELKETDYLW
ncbi:site-specific DNA-methyltransferase [Mycoplasma sp. VS424B]|uniref:site-specific DNA-methyltransferase n=1 Tax=Mycoplasma sp. VS424B TaxID=3401660 RepID=UPI003AAD69AF